MLEMIPEGHPLEGMRLKLERAQEHLDAFEGKIDAFLEREPYQVSYKQEADGTEHVYTVHVIESPSL
jgi:hypothetical protein